MGRRPGGRALVRLADLWQWALVPGSPRRRRVVEVRKRGDLIGERHPLGVTSPRAEGGTGARRPDPPGPVPARPRPASPGGMLRPGSPKPRLGNEAGQDLKGEP